MTRFFVAAVLALLSLASQAAITTYEWTIDWANRADQSGTLVFDDGGDASARAIFWDVVAGQSVPPTLTGLPPGLGVLGSLAFNGSFVTGVQGCDDPYNACARGGTTRFGYTSVNFSLSSFGDALNHTYNYTGGDFTSPCLQSNLLATMPDSCFAIDRGATTFAAMTTPVPEPSTWALLLAGLLGAGLLRRRQRRFARFASARAGAH